MKTISFILALLVSTIAYGINVKAKVTQMKGEAQYQRPGSLFKKDLKEGMYLSSGTIIITGTESEVYVSVTPGAAIRIDQNTVISLSDMAFEKSGDKVIERKGRVQLLQGTISALVDENAPEVTDFRIQTPQGTAAARGTFYGVSVVDGNTYVKVEQGKVGFQKAGSEE